jgi:ATP-dependent helicase/nuclease subunit B
LLLRVALEWAALAAPAPTECLFSWQPSAWIALRLGGVDPAAESLLAHTGIPSLRLLADPPLDEPFAAVCTAAGVERLLCDDFEAEAMAAASAVITAVNDRRTPVALVALDRALVRRVRALLEREGVPLIDETGWLLATTRAAAAVAGLLQAALPGASRDALLDWLKGWPGAAGPAVDALEALWRGRRNVPQRAAADHLWTRAQEHLRPLSSAGTQTLARWLGLLQERLAADGSLDRLASDAAGAQVLAALRLHGDAGAAWQQAARNVRLDLAGFAAWVESTLEQAPFLPPPDAGAEVVLTPLARVFGRPFGHIVVPGADHRRLGATPARPSLIGDALAAALGLDHAAARRQRQRLALAHMLRAGGVSLMRRHRDADEPLSESPDIEWLLLSRACSGAPAWPLQAWRPASRRVPPQPVLVPCPSAASALPELLSASQLEALRQCPYRFFARAVLRLDEPEELDTDLAKRDYGTWLHAVLHRFHSTRARATDQHAWLQAAADAVTHEQALDPGELLPYRASFETFVPAYLGWLAEREARGWHWADGESDYRLAPPELAGLRLRGRIDRLDHGPTGASQLLDYKTGSADALARKVKQPLEDTQLAFYAALLGGGEDLAAAYLALDDANAPREIAHPDVHRSAAALLHGLGQEWQRLQQGAALPALGEGRVCETCEARGLCRRDHWSRR